MAKAAKKTASRRAPSAAASSKGGEDLRRPRKASPSTDRSRIPADILAYNAAQSPDDRKLCGALATLIHQNLPGAECKVWHRHPVWFLDGNPIVGYHKLKDCVRLLFWSGRSFDEPGLAPEAGFQTAGVRYNPGDRIAESDLRRWLRKSIEIQWDYKNIVKRKGRLERLK